MRPTAILHAAKRTPLIKFLGKRQPPKSPDHTPHPHPASPTHDLPNSFASYRSNAQQHGPLGGNSESSHASTQTPSGSPSSSSSTPTTTTSSTTYPYGAIGGHTGASLGPVQPKTGEFFDRNDLPARFRRTPWTDAEIDAVETGGASMFG